jgi:hypothetical protein
MCFLYGTLFCTRATSIRSSEFLRAVSWARVSVFFALGETFNFLQTVSAMRGLVLLLSSHNPIFVILIWIVSRLRTHCGLFHFRVRVNHLTTRRSATAQIPRAVSAMTGAIVGWN